MRSHEVDYEIIGDDMQIVEGTARMGDGSEVGCGLMQNLMRVGALCRTNRPGSSQDRHNCIVFFAQPVRKAMSLPRAAAPKIGAGSPATAHRRGAKT